MGKAISQKIFDEWVKAMELYLMCWTKERLSFLKELHEAEQEYEKKHQVECSIKDDFMEGAAGGGPKKPKDKPKRGKCGI